MRVETISVENPWYRQCTIRLKKGVRVSWLPESVSTVGKRLLLTDDSSEEGVILAVGGRRREDYLVSKGIEFLVTAEWGEQ